MQTMPYIKTACPAGKPLSRCDGRAMKFVKGDTIAGIIVVLVNIIGGIIIAIVQYDMSMSEAVHTYSVLSIGDVYVGNSIAADFP
ncbi:secretion system apparatus protein SsaV [Salmonella enterica subsp. enterica serovar Typhimurium]|nr:secretion system apparatus protein SsaV [Salmonella enterica subsp. enterica serovar Typhimurium]